MTDETADGDPPEVAELEEAAVWRLRRFDADPADRQSAAAAQSLQTLADGLRGMGNSPLLAELHALCNWLDESGNISDFAQAAHAYRTRIGVDRHPTDATAYLRALLELARQAM